MILTSLTFLCSTENNNYTSIPCEVDQLCNGLGQYYCEVDPVPVGFCGGTAPPTSSPTFSPTNVPTDAPSTSPTDSKIPNPTEAPVPAPTRVNDNDSDG